MAEGTGRAHGRRRGRLIVTTVLVVIGVVGVLILVGTTLSPSANAVLALVVFGGLLCAFILWQRLASPREIGAVEEAIAGEETEL
jgi:threonine/homoserine/homoserine lactone efflux protein